MNVGAPRPMSHAAAVMLQDAQQLAGLIVQRAAAAAAGLDGLAPDGQWQPVEIRPGVLAWAQPPAQPSP